MNGEPLEAKDPSWHRGSRFYRLGGHALYMAGSFVYLAGGFRPEYVQEALGSFGLVAGLLLGGASWINSKERDVSKAEVEAGTAITKGGGGS